MLVSVIFPSRGRPSALQETVIELRDMAARPDDVEILVAADPDDIQTIMLSGHIKADIIIAHERHGYALLHRYLNKLASLAKGEWLFMWNDDAHIKTSEWDDIIRQESPAILWPASNYAPNINTFPVWPASWTRHLGHVSLDQSADMWIYELGLRTGLQHKIPVTIQHDHVTDDKTAAERDAVASVLTFHHPAMVAAREKDAQKLQDLVR